MEENGIKLLGWFQVPVICCKAPCFWTEVVVERLPAKPYVVLLGSVSLVPEQNIFQLGFACILLSVFVHFHVYVITIVVEHCILIQLRGNKLGKLTRINTCVK